ncbi:MAG: multicopper oxidase domain-containing protein [Bacteroidetes bacterium]|nr:multicopper oxidase domain-containing protein [Bacteroidota bacterium]
MKQKLLGIAFIFIALQCAGGNIYQKIYINKGMMTGADTTLFPALAFNSTSAFSQENTRINLKPGDSLHLWVVNNDSDAHFIRAQGFGMVYGMKKGDSLLCTFSFSKEGVYILYDRGSNNKFSYLGLATMICVSNSTKNNFYWNIKEQEKSYNKTLANDSPVNWKKYLPDYFTINSRSYPVLQKDTAALVKGKVGDTIRIFVANTGISMHAMHFHGFHTKAIFCSDANMIGWQKDTWNMKPMQTFILEMIPDKPGMYPVHDHNLVTLTGGGRYPNGMMVMMEITK